MAQSIRFIGQEKGLQFAVQNSDQEKQWPGLGWLKVTVRLNGTPIWFQEDDQGQALPVEWTWVDFLSGLARAWPWLVLEHGYPIPIAPLHPGQIHDVAQKRWESMPQKLKELEEDSIFDFKMCHDFSSFMRGIFLPSLWLILEGDQYQVWSPEMQSPMYIPAREINNTLTEFGDYLIEKLHDSNESRGRIAVEKWSNREQELRNRFLPLATGLANDLVRNIAGDQNPLVFFEITDTESANDNSWQLCQTELMAAARMTTGYLSFSSQKIIMELIRDLPKASCLKIDGLSGLHPNPEVFGEKAYEQGYGLAKWLRNLLKVAPENRFDCDYFLKKYEVALKEISFDQTPGLDAIAVWGPKHGPAILLNIAEATHSSTNHGRRSTIAHEICHIICDRSGSLPLVEVLGGKSFPFSEKRARAFAAELLLPQDFTVECVLNEKYINKAADYLLNHFDVSRDIVFHQIMNSKERHQASPKRLETLKRWRYD